MDLYGLIYVAVAIMGVAAIISAIMMKKNVKIPKWMLRGYQVTADSDVPGFIKQMFGYTVYAGVLLIMYGLYGAVSFYVMQISMDKLIATLFLVFVFAYLIMITGAKSKFLKPLQ